MKNTEENLNSAHVTSEQLLLLANTASITQFNPPLSPQPHITLCIKGEKVYMESHLKFLFRVIYNISHPIGVHIQIKTHILLTNASL